MNSRTVESKSIHKYEPHTLNRRKGFSSPRIGEIVACGLCCLPIFQY